MEPARPRRTRRDDGGENIEGEDMRELRQFAHEGTSNAKPNAGESEAANQPDPVKRNAIDEIWNALGDVEQSYDAWLSFAQTWRQRLEKGQRDDLASGLRQRREAMSNAIVKVANLCEHRHGNIEDIYKFRMSHQFGGGRDSRKIKFSWIPSTKYLPDQLMTPISTYSMKKPQLL